jgi:3'-5' exoribonuclease
VETYNGARQVVIDEAEPVEPDGAMLRELLPVSPEPVEAMVAEVKERLEGVRHEGLRALVGVYLGDTALMEKFCVCPAAMRLHHAYLGGLLEHTRNLLRLADGVCPLYPRISRDVVTVGVFIHDMAKVREQTWERGFGYTARGQLVGHVVDGVLMLRARVKQAKDAGAVLSEELVMCLEHIVLSHHGQPEHGAARLPATPEAILVHYLDNIDAKMAIALEAARPEGAGRRGGDGDSAGPAGDAFTEKMWALDNVRLFRPDPA